MNPGASRTARLWPAPARNQPLKQEENPKKQQTYPQTTSSTATTEGGSILDANSGSVLNANQQFDNIQSIEVAPTMGKGMPEAIHVLHEFTGADMPY